MPVIQLPRDTRWSELGEGINKFVTGLTEAYQEKKTNEAVAQIIEDPLLTEPAKLTKIMKNVPNGLERYKALVATQVLQATVEEKKAEAAKNQAAADQAGGQSAVLRALNGLPPKAAAPPAGGLPTSTAAAAPAVASAPTATAPATPSAEPSASGAIVDALGGTPAPAPAPAPTPTLTPLEAMIDERARMGGVTFTPAERQSLATITNAHLSQKSGFGEIMAPVDAAINMKKGGMELPSKLQSAQAGATTAGAGAATAAANAEVELEKKRQELAKLREEAPYTGPTAAATAQIKQQEAAANAPGKLTPQAVGASFPTFSDEQKQSVAAMDQTKGPAAAAAEISRVVGENAKPAVTESTAKFARDTASYGAITERFANQMVAAPEKLGLLSLSGVRARLEANGLPAGDPQLVGLLNSQKLAAATAARENGQWGVSGTNLKISKDTSANIDKTVMSNVMMFAGAADQKIKEAEVEKLAYAGNPRAQAVIDQAIKPWRNIQAITNTLSASTVPVDAANPKKGERDVVYFMGNQVDPNSMRALVRQDGTQYKVKPQLEDKRTEISGEEIFGMARAKEIDPVAMLIQLGGRP